MKTLAGGAASVRAVDIPTFFNEALPDLIQQRSAAFNKASGSLCIIVHGAGAWTLRFGDHTLTNALEDGLDLDADLVVTWSEAQFQSLIDGAPAHGALEPITMGEVGLLTHLGTLLTPPAKGGLGARLMF